VAGTVKPSFQRYTRNARNVKFYASIMHATQGFMQGLCTQRKVQNTPRKRKRTCSNLMQAMQKVANGIAEICHVIQDTGRN